MSRFYITTAIDYVNSRPHLGTAYEKITADVIARYKRSVRNPDAFPDGKRRISHRTCSAARKSWASIHLAYCDQMEQTFRDVWARLDISFDDFIRTTQPRHRTAVDGARAPCSGAWRYLRWLLRGLVLRILRGIQAGEGPRRRPVRRAREEA